MMLKCTKALAAMLLLASCAEEPSTPFQDLTDEAAIKPATQAPQPMPAISDGRTDGNAEFYFLWPIVEDRAPKDRPFDGDARPTVAICRVVNGVCRETVAEFPYADGRGLALRTVRERTRFDFYIATWLTPKDQPGRYRATVSSFGVVLGFADIQLVRGLPELRSVPQDIVGVLAGWPLPLPFRVERPTCTTTQVRVILRRGVTGAPSQDGAPGCGVRLPFSYQSEPGFDAPVVFVDGAKIPGAQGVLWVKGAHEILVTALDRSPLSPAEAELFRALAQVPTANDKSTAFSAFLQQAVRFARSVDAETAKESLRKVWARAGGASSAEWGAVEEALQEGPLLIDPEVSASASAGAWAPPSGGRRTVVAFANGVLNDLDTATESLVALDSVVRDPGTGISGHLLGLLYNRKAGLSLSDAVKCALKANMGLPIASVLGAMRAAGCLLSSESDFSESAREVLRIAAGTELQVSDVIKMRQSVRGWLDADRQVLFVAHSQGNLMTRQMVDGDYGIPFSPAERGRIAVVSVAPPGSRPTGLAGSACWVVRGDILEPAALSASCPERVGSVLPFADCVLIDKRDPVSCGIWLHNFANSYLANGPGRQRMVEALRALEEVLDQVPSSPKTITVTSPGTGDSWRAGEGRVIRWLSSGFSSADRVEIGLEYPGFSYRLGDAPIGNGAFTFTVPFGLASRPDWAAVVTWYGPDPATTSDDIWDVGESFTIAPSSISVNLSTDQHFLNRGETSVLVWSATNATSCSASWTASTATSGSQAVTPVVTTIYTMTCRGPGGTASANTTVTVVTPLPTGLVAFYPLDGDGADKSGNGNNGTLSDGVVPAAGRAGPGTALDFSGSGVVTVPSNPAIKALTTNLTIVAWVRRGPNSITSGMIPVSRRNGIPIHFELYSQPQGFGFQCCSTTANVTGLFYHPTGNGLAVLNDGQWHQVAVTRRFGIGGSTQLYLDGVLVPGNYTSGSADDPAPVMDADLLIGRQLSASPGQFNGVLDNVYIFNRVLSASEIQALP